ncbi:MAG: protein kinase [Planctomycetaceae bacterium]
MMSPLETCPTSEQLSRLLTAQLAPAAERELLSHLDTCENCQQRMLRLSGSDDELLNRLNELGNEDVSSSDTLQRALRQLKEEVSPCGDDDALPFLQPANAPNCLGQIGPYEVLDVIGRGGMGIVLKARDPALNRLNAVKVLLPEIASSRRARQRFLREARAAAAISHENLVTIFAVDEFQGFPFLVMEYIEGVSVQVRLSSNGPFAIGDVLRIGVQIAGGLTAAHACGVIHRDIKPDNILLNGIDGRVKITDFGLAHVIDDVQLTQTGVVAGTPPYMSPEQAQGETVDSRSDLFSLGCVLYAMCAGASPFQGRSTIDTIRRVCDAVPLPLKRINAQAPDSLIAVIDRLLAKNPIDRFQTAADVLAALKQCGETPGDRAADIRATKSLSRNAHGGDEIQPFDSWSSWQSRVAAGIETPSIAVLPFANMSSDPDNEYFGDGLAEDLIEALTRFERVFVVARSSAFQFKGQAMDVRDVGRRLNVRTVLEGSVRKSGDRIRIAAKLIDVATGYHLWSQRYDRDLKDVFAVQDDIARTIVEELRIKFAAAIEPNFVKRRTDDVNAYSRYLRGRFYWNKRDPASLRRAIEYYDQALAVDSDYAAAWAGKADCEVLLADYALTDQQQALSSAKRCATRALELDETLAEAHKAMGFVLACHDRDWPGAERHFQRALEIDPHSAGTRLAYALGVLLPLARFDEALRESQRAVELDPVTPMIVAGPGVVLSYHRQFEAASRLFDDALDVDPTHPVVNLWSCPLWIEMQDYGRAMAAAQCAGPFQLMADEFVAMIHAHAGRPAEAEAILTQFHADVDRGRREATLSLGRVYTALGQTDLALTWLERAIQERIVATVFFNVDPTYDRLHEQPRFEALLDELRLR